MKAAVFATIYALSLFARDVVAQSSPTSTVLALKPIQTMNCSKTNGTLQKVSSYDFASDGWCQRLCGGQNFPVMAMTAGSMCYCGSSLPALDQSVPESNCNSPCAGFNQSNCGGIGYYQIYLTGLTDVNISRDPNTTSSSSSSSSSSSTTATKAPATVVVTTSANASGNSGTNKIGIAVGVVVGLIVTASIIGAVVFFMRQRQKQAIEDEHRRLEAQAAALAAEKSDTASTHTDQRLDPSNIFSHRRESIGSIADEMDFSRRILQVRNPDRFSTNSPVP